MFSSATDVHSSMSRQLSDQSASWNQQKKHVKSYWESLSQVKSFRRDGDFIVNDDTMRGALIPQVTNMKLDHGDKGEDFVSPSDARKSVTSFFADSKREKYIFGTTHRGADGLWRGAEPTSVHCQSAYYKKTGSRKYEMVVMDCNPQATYKTGTQNFVLGQFKTIRRSLGGPKTIDLKFGTKKYHKTECQSIMYSNLSKTLDGHDPFSVSKGYHVSITGRRRNKL